MSYKKVWMLAFVAMCFSGLAMYADFFIGKSSYNAITLRMRSGWSIASETTTLYKAADFEKVGSLKNERNVVLTATLPSTKNKSVGFVTISYKAEAFVDGKKVYSFGSALDSSEVWGVKTHIFDIPDGEENREFKLVLSTNQPAYIAVSKYFLFGSAAEIIRTMQHFDMIKIAFAVLYMTIGIFLFLILAVLALYRKFDFSLLMLAFIPLLIGIGIFMNISSIAFYTGPEAVCWIVSIVNLILPVPALLFVAAGKSFEKSRLLWAAALDQSVFFAMYVVCNLLHIDCFLLSWHLILFVAVSIVMIGTFLWEFKSGEGRPLVAVSVFAILLTSVINAYSYFTAGNHDTMDLSLIILTLPVVVLMSGEVLLRAVQRESELIHENVTLRLKDKLLYENYNNIEKYIEETKQIWHDIDKHLSIIHLFIQNGDYDDLKRYMKHIGFSLTDTKKLYLCENRLINAILTDKMSEAQSKDIAISIKGNLPEELNIPGNDLCSLLVNMLDNAIEACEKIPEGDKKKIELSMKMKQGFIYFEVFNTVNLAPRMEGSRVATSKEHTEKHGYGLSIIRKITDKYNGAFDVISSEDTFLVKAALKNAPVEHSLSTAIS